MNKIVGAAALLMASLGPAAAATVTLNYSGSFSQNGQPMIEDTLTATVTFDDATTPGSIGAGFGTIFQGYSHYYFDPFLSVDITTSGSGFAFVQFSSLEVGVPVTASFTIPTCTTTTEGTLTSATSSVTCGMSFAEVGGMFVDPPGPTATPLPGALTLFVTGLVGLLWRAKGGAL